MTQPKGHGQGARGAAALDRAAKDAEALRLRFEERLTLREIAERMGIDHQMQVSRMIDRAVARTPTEHPRAHRGKVLDRYEYLWQQTQEEIEGEHHAVSFGKLVLDPDGKPVRDAMPKVAAMRVATQILKGVREVTGVDAPAKRQVEVITEDMLTVKIRELEAELGTLEDRDRIVGSNGSAASAARGRQTRQRQPRLHKV